MAQNSVMQAICEMYDISQTQMSKIFDPEQTLSQILARVQPVAFSDIDSLDWTELIVDLEDRLDISLGDAHESLRNAPVKDLIAYVECCYQTAHAQHRSTANAFDLITITGPSCSGKTTLERSLCSIPTFSRVISQTTRPPRLSEVPCVDYYFNTDEEFHRLKDKGLLIECVHFSNYWYGASEGEISKALASNKVPVLVCEPIGLQQVAEWCKRTNKRMLSIVFMPQDYQVERFVVRLNSMIAQGSLPKSILDRMRSFIYEKDCWTSMASSTHKQFQGTVHPMFVTQFDTQDTLNSVVSLIKLLNECRKVEEARC